MRGLAGAAVVGLVAACGGPQGAAPYAGRPGLTLTYYVEAKQGAAERLVLVEQRRWIDLGAHRTFDIDRIDDAADLETLVVESLSRQGALAIGRCLRDPLTRAAPEPRPGPRAPGEPARPPPVLVGRHVELTVAAGATVRGTIVAHHVVGERRVVIIQGEEGRTVEVREDAIRSVRYTGLGGPGVRCEIARGSGRHLVRVVYTTASLGFRAEHTVHAKLDVDGVGTAEIVPRFTVDTPPWQITADVALYDGVPGGHQPPQLVFRGPIKVTGEPVVVTSAPRHAPARIDSVYRGAVAASGEAPTEPYWRHASVGEVWEWLDIALGDHALPRGRAILDVARAGQPPIPMVVEADGMQRADAEAGTGALQIRLWPAADLRGTRMKTPITSTGGVLAESLAFSISNAGDRPRLVVIEEVLRPAKRRRVLHPFPKKPTTRDGVLRMRVGVEPGRATRAGWVVEYAF